jgi:hypothetical protein
MENTSQQVDNCIAAIMKCIAVKLYGDTSQKVDNGIAALMKSISVNIIWKILHSRRTMILQFQ